MFKIQMLSLETLINLVVGEDWKNADKNDRQDRVVSLSHHQIEPGQSRACDNVAAATDEVLQNV